MVAVVILVGPTKNKMMKRSGSEMGMLGMLGIIPSTNRHDTVKQLWELFNLDTAPRPSAMLLKIGGGTEQWNVLRKFLMKILHIVAGNLGL